MGAAEGLGFGGEVGDGFGLGGGLGGKDASDGGGMEEKPLEKRNPAAFP